ncbi:MAG: GGDEF domain-containing protein [Luteimonas sp.]
MKSALRQLCVVLGLAAILWPPVSGATQPVGELLKQAEQQRSSNPAAFRELLARLDGQAGAATPSERQQIAYLDAYQLSMTGHLDESIRQAKRLISRTTDAGLKFRAGALVVNSYALSGNYNDGLRQLEETFRLMDEVKDPALREHALISATTLYNQIGQYQLASHYAEQVMHSPASGRSLCFAGFYEYDALQKLDLLPEDDAPLFKAISNCVAQHETIMANFVRVTLARKWVREGHKDRAIALLTAHLAEAEATGYPRVIAESTSLLAELFLARGDVAMAEQNARAAVIRSEKIANTPPVVSALLTLYKIADRRRDPAAALAAYKRYSEAERGYLEEVKARELAYHLVRLEARQKNQQIQLLDRQNRLLQLQQRVEQQKAANSRLLMFVFAIFTLFVVFWAYKTKRMQMSVRRMAETDALTGICNRHHFTLQADKMLAQGARAGEQASLIMFDLDHFKAINDNFGHVTGDWVLREVAKTCSELCRRVDYFGRLGGEEFAILLRGCELKAATRIAEDCRVRLARIDSSGSGFDFRITASFGVSSTATSKHDLDKLLSQADQVLYRAKREGRNRVNAYSTDATVDLKEHVARHAPSQREPATEAAGSSA